MEFVHSFPRESAGKSDSKSIQRAVRMLEMLLIHGPLLIPEIIIIPELEGTNQRHRAFPILQNRFCFTVFERKMVRDHMSVFGPISITFNYEALVLSGAVPVFYFPSFEGSYNTNDLGVTLIHRLRIILEFLQNYRDLKTLSHEELSYVLDLNVKLEDLTQFNELLAAFEKACNLDESVFSNMEGALQSISELLYPTDRSRDIERAKLQYFAQREWRLLSDLKLSGKEVSEYLDNSIKTELLDLNYNFFNSGIEFQNRFFRRVDLVQKLTIDHYNRFIKGVTGIYVDKQCFDFVSKMIKQSRFNIPIQVV